MILRMKDVCSELGVSRASIYRLLVWKLSKPVKLGKRAIGWAGPYPTMGKIA